MESLERVVGANAVLSGICGKGCRCRGFVLVETPELEHIAHESIVRLLRYDVKSVFHEKGKKIGLIDLGDRRRNGSVVRLSQWFLAFQNMDEIANGHACLTLNGFVGSRADVRSDHCVWGG